MKTVYLFLAIIMTSCLQSTNKVNVNKNLNETSESASKDSVDHFSSKADDSSMLNMFWTEIVVPIIQRDKNKVIGSMDFPVRGDWTLMMDLDKEAGQGTREDFVKVYDKFFNNYFVTELAKMNYNNVSRSERNDTVWYQFSINRILGEGENAGEGAVALIYYYSDGKFKLKNIQGVGGDFYFDK
jgi:hypothetical protein